MAARGESIGMMEGAFFVGRGELLKWLNELLGITYTKVEQCSNGAAYCQIMDSLYPGKVPMSKVKFDAKLEYEAIKNFKVLQDVFNKLQINKHIFVDKLVRGKYQDNLEFLQWMKRYWDIHSSGSAASYNADERRTTAPPPASSTKKPIRERNAPAPASRVAKTSAAAAAGGPKARELQGRVDSLQTEVAELKLTVDGLEKERNFYFGKLRDIEIMCQTNDTDELKAFCSKVQEILYATDDNEEFVPQEGAEAANEEGIAS